jgi:hypothetical protein
LIDRPRKTAAVQLVAKRVVRFKGDRIIRLADLWRKAGSTSHRAGERQIWLFDQTIDQRRS